MLIYLLLYGALGAALGSFSTFLTHRFLSGESILRCKLGSDVSPHRSACPACKTPLSVFELFPVLSWLFLRGKCKTCGAGISIFYPLTEVFCISLACLVFLRFGLSVQGWFVLASLPVLCTLFVVDMKRMILPDPLVLVLGVLGVGYTVALWLSTPFSSGGIVGNALAEHLGGGLVFGVTAYGISKIMTVILKKNALGFGDVKFFVVVGLWLGLSALSAFMILSGALGVLTALLWRKIHASGAHNGIFPFGPALIVSFLTLLFYHDSLVHIIL